MGNETSERAPTFFGRPGFGSEQGLSIFETGGIAELF
jgi:hypothetical protein